MKDSKSIRKLAGRGVIIEWNDHARGPDKYFRQAKLFEFSLYSIGLLRKGEAKFI